tara:strand:+ start:1655 stop:2590 length:936 start_codon:yes stop_codon:yes gene_type:complete
MAEKAKRELYSFTIDIEEEVEKEVIKEVKRKNKETGKMETVEETVTKTIVEKTPVRAFLKKPTRTQVEDGDMFYSIWLNKFIKMGLLTRAMLAKKQVDVGGTLNDDDKMNYAKLYLQLFEKQQNVIRYSAKDPDTMSNDEKERLQDAISSLAVIRKQLSDFEAAQASIFDHTADVKARNKTITWFLLHLAFYIKGDEDEDAEALPLFPGTDFDEKYVSYQEADEEQEEVFVKTIDRLSTISTIWYMSGIQEQEEFEGILKQMEQETEVTPEEIIPEPEPVAEEKPKKAAKKRGRPSKKAEPEEEAAPVNEE